MARDPMLDYLDAQWRAFRQDLEESYCNSREAVRKVAAGEPGTWRYLLSHIKWSNGEPIEIGIAVIRDPMPEDPHAN